MQSGDQVFVFKTAVGIEPGIKVISVVEHIRQQEVEQGPQLVQVVLQGGARQQQAVGRLELSDNLRQLGLFILDPVGLVNDNVTPVELLQHRLLPDHHLIGSDAHVPVPGHQGVCDEYSLREGGTD